MKLFGTDGIRGKANVYPMTPEIALQVGKAAGIVFRNGHNKKTKVVIGKDTRLSGYLIESALMSGLLSVGVDVYLVGPMPTPAIAHLTKSFAADAGIVISASHNPYEDNGIKFFDAQGWKLPDEIEEKIEQLALGQIKTDDITGEAVGSAKRINDARGRYIEFAKNTIHNHSLKGLKIVVDCANGAAYDVAKYIFSELGADVIVTNASPSGKNINDGCGAVHPEALQAEVVKQRADAGIALDGDADRIIMVDEKGNIVDGDQIIAIAALDLKQLGKLPNNTVVVTVMSNLGFVKAMRQAGITVIQTQVGDRYVLDEMKKHGYSIGGEQSGHISFLDYTTTGDGLITALQLLNIMKKTNKPLSALAAIMTKFPQIIVNVDVKEKRDLAKMPTVHKAITDAQTALQNSGRALVRYSGTQNVLRVMLEGEDEKKITLLANTIAKEVRHEIGA